MTLAPDVLAVKPFFGGFILETLTIGMYAEGRNALREYVQNAFDSIQKATSSGQIAPGTGLIRVIVPKSRTGITIRDNGAGLPLARAAETLVAIGASSKDYRRNAGFRGIGRLAGIAFSDAVVFTTKALGEAEQTEVAFDGRLMREMMSPEKGSSTTAEELLLACVKVRRLPSAPTEPAFFEVALNGFSAPPEECKDVMLLERYLAQVAPVPYSVDFERSVEVRSGAAAAGLPVDEVVLRIEPEDQTPVQVFKPYGAAYDVQDSERDVVLTEIKPYSSPTKRWWGWVGVKDAPGQYLDPDVRGIRMRVRNIQIDGESLVRGIFQQRSASSARYQDWFIGEIFVDPETLTPNARRDGFEDTPAWREVQKEIADSICKDAGSLAQSVSNKGQYTEERLTERTSKLEQAVEKERERGFRDQDRALTLSADMTRAHADIAKAMKNAQPSTSAALQQLAARILDAKSEAMMHLGETPQRLDRERIEHEARQELLRELLATFEDRLSIPCLSSVRGILREEYDFPQH